MRFNDWRLITSVIFMWKTIGMALPIATCDQEKLDALAAHYQCQESKSISMCGENTYLTVAGSFLLLPRSKNSNTSFESFIKLNNLGNNPKVIGTSKLGSSLFIEVQDIFRELEIKRIKMDSDHREFSNIFTEELEKKIKANNGKLRLWGGKEPSIRNYYLAIQKEMNTRLPNNVFTQNFNKGAKSAGDLIQRSLENVVIDRYPDSNQKWQRPSIEKYIRMQRDRYEYRFFAKMSKSMPNLPIKSSVRGMSSSFLKEELQSYRRFRSEVLGPDVRSSRYVSAKNLGNIEVSNSSKSCGQQSRSNFGRAAVGAAGAVFANFAMGTTRKISSLKTLQDCQNKFGLNLSAENLEYLSRSSYLATGLVGGMDCRNIRFESASIQKLTNIKDEKLNQFLCRMHDDLYEGKNLYEDYYPDGIEWSCDGHIMIPNGASSSATAISNDEIQIQTSKGSLVKILTKSTGDWQLETISSDDDTLQQYLIDKIRQPFISQDARKSQLSLEFACHSKSIQAGEMCEIAKHLEAAKNLKAICL
jgi:hypothetical protein